MKLSLLFASIFLPIFINAAPTDWKAEVRSATTDEARPIENLISDALKDYQSLDGPLGLKKLLMRMPDQDSPEAKKLRSEIHAKTQDMAEKYNKAIHLALRIYKIMPLDTNGRLDPPQGKIVAGTFTDRTKQWIPQAGNMFDENGKLNNPVFAIPLDPGGNTISPLVKGPHVAETYPNGVTTIFIETLNAQFY